MAPLLPGTTPAAPDDDGRVDPAYAAAVATGDAARIHAAIVEARLLVPVVAMPAPDADAEMAIPALVAADGARALPVFSSYDELRAWRADARPVPMSGVRVILGAAGEGYDGIVIDVAGERPVTIADDDLRALVHRARAVHTSSPG